MQLVDIGINLTHDQFDPDRDEVLTRAFEQNVVQFVLTGTDPTGSEHAHAYCRQHDPLGTHLFSTAGVHPHDAKTWNAETEQRIRALLDQPQVKAVGECGLDFNRDFSPRADQQSAFEAQLALAIEHGMPLFLHERDASARMVEILQAYRDYLGPAIIHCFTGEREALHAYLDLDLHIGMTGWICDERRGGHLHALVRDIPAGRLMIETDAPYLLPRTLRPRPKRSRNEPAYLRHIAAQIAHHRGESIEALAEHTTACARRFFELPVIH